MIKCLITERVCICTSLRAARRICVLTLFSLVLLYKGDSQTVRISTGSIVQVVRKAGKSNNHNTTSVHVERPEHNTVALWPDLANHTANVLPDIAGQVLQLERRGLGKKVIAMSLYGANPRYVQGALENAELVQRDWRGWTLRIYYGNGVPQAALHNLTTMGVELVHVKLREQSPRLCMYWRFQALEDRNATRVIIRDADARLTLRDRSAVLEWENSNRLFHTMHDNRYHNVPILGGMWGAVNGLLNPRILEDWRQSGQDQGYGNDQGWLRAVVWPLVKNNTLNHASFLCGQWGAAEWPGFPTKRLNDRDFVGNVYGPGNNALITGQAECPMRCRRQADWVSC